jgi:hypothetical protein
MITERRVKEHGFDLDPPLDVWVDGVRMARGASRLHVSVRADAGQIVI